MWLPSQLSFDPHMTVIELGWIPGRYKDAQLKPVLVALTLPRLGNGM